MLLAVVGKSGSAKDTLSRYVMCNYDFRPVVSYTTRPKGAMETDGVEHYFITGECMEYLKRNGDIVAYSKNTETGFEYCATKDSLCSSDESNILYIIDPAGIECLKEKGIEFKSIYIDVDEDILIRRLLDRKRESSNKILVRIGSEREVFDSFREKADYVINNNGTIEEFYENIDSIMESLK